MRNLYSLLVLPLISITGFSQTPTQACPSPITVPNDAGLCGAVVTYTIPTCTSNCTGTTIYQADGTGLTSGSFFSVGTVDLKYIITNGVDSSTCIFKVQVDDVEDPVISCTTDFDEYLDSGCDFVIPDYTTSAYVTATDNCNVDSITQTPIAGTVISGSGTTQVIVLKAYDPAGNNVSCGFTITVQDTLAPTLVCPGTVTEPTTIGCQAVLQNYVALTAVSDNCDSNPVVTQSPASGTSFTTSQTVTIYAEDVDGNIDSCSFLVVANDISAPSITCPGNMTEYVDAACEYVLPDLTSLAVATDNCDPSLTYSQSPIVGDKISGANTNHFISLQATDVAGNSSVCSFQISLLDTLAPTFGNCQDITVPLDQNCEYTLANLVSAVGIVENCSSYTTLQVPASGAVVSGETSTTVIITATDLSSNVGTCIIEVITADTTSPNIATCPSNQTVSAGTTGCDYSVTDFTSSVFAVDNCTSSLTITQSLSVGDLLSAGSTTTMDMTVMDASGNTSMCSFDITVVDLVAPVIPCPSNPTVPVDATCSYTIPSYDTVIALSDNCGTIVNYSQAPVAGTVISTVGTQQSISIFAEDGNGNNNSCSFTITLGDTTAPSIICPGTQSIATTANCQYQIPDFSSLATITDFCDPSPSYAQSPAVGTTVTGIITVTLTGTDMYGNANTCTFTTQPADTTDPTITCPSDSSACNPIFTFSTPFGNDDCGIVTVTQTDGSGYVSGDSFPTGVTTIEFTATDNVGNTASCSFDLTVYPAPVITLVSGYTIDEPDSVYLDATVTGYTSLSWSPSFNLSDDTIANPLAEPSATTTYTLTAVSDQGCESTASVTVVVNQIDDLIINNFLSPNADGKNDYWTMNKPALISGCTVSIYDRWGKLAWESTSYNNDWDGKNTAGVDLPDGTYFYSITCAGDEDIKGSILLMR